jgi:leucyl aminopeptidase
MTPAALARTARSLAGGRLSVKVLTEREISREGMHAYLSVSAGSQQPPRFIVMEYKGARKRPVVLIGKSITFDSGGISIKPAEGMEKMKYDMAGGAAVLGVMKALASRRMAAHVVGILPAAENLPGGGASRPGDVVKTMNGRTIEIVSTDAEGRMTLADAIAYAIQYYRPEVIIDIATLTGACAIAFGNEAIAMMGNSEDVMARLKRASEDTYERVWQMPLYDEYKEYLKSETADMKNSGGRKGSLCASGYFLKDFAGRTPWVHLDIAGMAWLDKERPYSPKGATGVGVRLLLRFLEETR